MKTPLRQTLPLLGLLFIITPAMAEPEPGDVFREYVYADNFSASIFDKRHDSPEECTVTLPKIDLEHAIAAEIAVDIWGGDFPYQGRKLRVNGHPWIPMPLPQRPNVPEQFPANEPEMQRYCFKGRPGIPVPLDQLQSGDNAITFWYEAEKGNYWIYGFLLRIYYDSALKPHPEGRILSPSTGAALDASVKITVETNSEVRTVDLLGHHLDYDWAGDGRFRKWQYQQLDGAYAHHVGPAQADPENPRHFSALWDTQWIPTSAHTWTTVFPDEPLRLMARLNGPDGISTMTEAVNGLTLNRPDYRVRLFIPQEGGSFRVRSGKERAIDIWAPFDTGVSVTPEACQVRLCFTTWGAHAGDEDPQGELTELRFNRELIAQKIGKYHDYDTHVLPLDPALIKRGINAFYVTSRREGHPFELNYPGPALLVREPLAAEKKP